MFHFENKQSRLAIGLWLALCCLLVLGIIILGAAVRLTGSGLSMVDWQPISGILPPLNIQQWQAEFNQYRQYPEYKLVNAGMSLSEFKFIFYMEYLHRILGRLIGLVFFIPMMFFMLKKKVTPALKKHLWVLLVLGTLQGFVGWYMVKSGLVNDPHVSQYRLVLHLSIAVFIYGYMLYLLTRMFISPSSVTINSHRLIDYGKYLLPVLLFMTILSGGFVAGTKAGFIYNTFPTMAGHWIPPQLFSLSPVWMNFFENPITIQFTHRVLAITTFILVTGYSLLFLRCQNVIIKILVSFLWLIVVVQVLLGITTLVMHVPALLAVLHQAGAMILFAVMIILSTILIYRQRDIF